MLDLVIDSDFLNKHPISYGALMAFKKSPSHYVNFITAKPSLPPPDTAIKEIVDCLLLTPDLFKEKFIIENLSNYTVDGKKRIKDYLSSGITPISQEFHDRGKSACKAINENPISQKILNTISQTRRELKWVDLETNLPLAECLEGDSADSIIEIKVAKNADPESFQKDAYNYYYFLKSAMYNDGLFYTKGKSPKNHYYIVVEHNFPFGVSVFKLSDDYFELGRQEFRSSLNEFKRCFDNKEFDKGYEWKAANGVHELHLPAWAINKLKRNE